MKPVEGTILTVVREAAEAARGCGRRRRDLVDGRRGRRPTRAQTRWPARPSCCRCSPRPASSTPAAPGFLLLLDAVLHVVDGRPMPEPVDADEHRRRRSAIDHGTRRPTAHGDVERPPLRGHVLPRGARRDHPRLQGRVGRHRRLDRGRRRRRPLELPHPHRRHRRQHRGRARLRPAPQHPGHRPARAGRGGALGARERRGGGARRAPEHRAGRHRGRGGGDRRRRPAHLPLARRAADRHRRPVDEPVDRASCSRRSRRRRPTRS